jgi:AcrR family transcriptional regulator
VPRAARHRLENPPSPSTAKRPADRRTRLLDAGTEIFASRPYEEVSVQEIAERAGVAHGLLFHYFGSKRGFFLAALERERDSVFRVFETNTTEDPARWLRRELDIFLVGISSEAAVAPMFDALVHGSLGAETEAQAIVIEYREWTAGRILAKLAYEGESSLLTSAVTAWVASANELAAQWLESGFVVPRAHIRRVLVSTLTGILRNIAGLDQTVRFDPDRFVDA